MNRRNKNIFIFLLLIFYMVIYRVFVCNSFLKYNESIIAALLLILAFVAYLFYGYRRIIPNYLNNKILKNTSISLIIYFIIIYFVGVVKGFLTNSYALTVKGIFYNVFPVAILIISTEILRYIFIRANRDKKSSIYIITVLLALLEVVLQVRYDSFSSVTQIFKFFSITVLPIVMKNVMCSYFAYQNDFRSNLVYRLFIDTYFYYVPIEPDLGDYMVSMFNLLLPFANFILNLSMVDTKGNQYIHNKNGKVFSKSDIPFAIGVTALIFVLLGIGPFKMVGIKTPSMTPNIKVGDAVLIDKTIKTDKIKVKDIIAYVNENDIIVVHRVININSDGTYITKGDYNNTADPVYVKKEQIVGKVILRIPYIAYPAMILRGEK